MEVKCLYTNSSQSSPLMTPCYLTALSHSNLVGEVYLCI